MIWAVLGFALEMALLVVAVKIPAWERRYRSWRWWRDLPEKDRRALVALHCRPSYAPRLVRQLYGAP